MRRSDDNDQPVLGELLAGKGGLIDRSLDEAKLRRAIHDCLGDLRGIADADSQRDLGIGPMKGY